MEFREKLTNPQYKSVVADLFSQAVVGELIGMKNFATISSIVDDPHEVMEAIEHANSERTHAEAFMKMAGEYDIPLNLNLQGIYWKSLRDRMVDYGQRKDFIACFIVQEIMLEAYAVSMYSDIGKKLPGRAGKLFSAIGLEEKEHLHHALEILQKEYADQGEAFILKVEKVHNECMTILSEWAGRKDSKGHCGVCAGNCMKESLPLLELDIVSLRGNALNLFVKMLDEIGIPGEQTLPWITNLAA